jgi:hypothetical protein
MIRIATLGVFDPASEEWIIGVFLLSFAATLVLRCTNSNRLTIADSVPLSYVLPFNKDFGHCFSPSLLSPPL